MGEMTLVIEAQDNQLNLYDFGSNPAWLVVDQHRSWLCPFFQANVLSGKFKRTYDPETTIDFNAYFEGVKVIDKNQVFWGLVDYHNLKLNHVYQAIDRDPYQEHPFRLADNTTGNIHYWGPTVSAKYSRNCYKQKLFWGASLDYQIETGLKDSFPQPRTIYRNIGLGTGFAYSLCDRLAIGSTFNYSHIREFIEVIPPSENELRTILIIKFRGERIGTERFGSMERFTRTKNIKWGMQFHVKPFDELESAFLVYYHIHDLDATESCANPVKDGTWKLRGYEIHWSNRLKIPNLPFQFGLSIDRKYFNDLAIHPEFDVILGDDHLTENSFGLGIAYSPDSRPLIIGVEYHLRLADKDKRDYISSLAGSGNMDNNVVKVGAELGFLRNWKLRTGYINQANKINPTLLSFSEFLPESINHTLTFGLAHFFKSMELEFFGFYGQQKPTVHQNNLKRDHLGLALSLKHYRW